MKRYFKLARNIYAHLGISLYLIIIINQASACGLISEVDTLPSSNNEMALLSSQSAQCFIGSREIQPRFPGCEEIEGTNAQKEECAKEKLLAYIYNNLEYPENAKRSGIEGMAIVQFAIDVDGSMVDVRVIRDPGEGLGNAALDMVLLMQNMEEKWVPGVQFGKIVKVMYTLPVKFKL